MAAKRKTKAQREQEERDALLRRLVDIYSGAEGGAVAANGCVFPVTLAKVLPAAQEAFGEPHADWFGWRPHCLDRWESPAQACDFLYSHGFRADKVWEEANDD